MTGGTRRSLALALVLAWASLPAGTGDAHGQARIPPSVELRVPKAPTIAAGSAGGFLAYELHVTNLTADTLEIVRVEVLGEPGAASLAVVADSALARNIHRPGVTVPAAARARVGGGLRAIVYLWVPVDPDAAPGRVQHRVLLRSVASAGEAGDSAAAGAHATEHTIRGASVAVVAAAPPIGAPLRGEWLAANGPGQESGHRRLVLGLEGNVASAQRFGADFLQIDASNRTHEGDAARNDSYYAYGAEAYAVADGVVVETKDGIPENIPGPQSRAVPITLETVSGNSVVIDIGDGRYAFYAHLIPGSLRVREGERVQRGQVIGLVGNSGNSTEPHLHFHVVDGVAPGTSTLGAEGIPYGIDVLEVVGSCSFVSGTCTRTASDTVRNGLPLQNQLVRLTVHGVSSDGDAPDPFAAARARIEDAVREVPSIAVAVAKDGEIVFAEGFGWSDLERRIPATPRTMYSLASISKPMTATALMRLVERGAVDLDRPANDYLGAGKIHSTEWDANGATVRRVLSHSAGLPLHYEFFYDGEAHAARDTDEGVARYGILIAPPGTVYQYSNLGYGIIERIVERARDGAYADIMQHDVFGPLGMTRTAVSTGAGLDDSVAVRYGPDNQVIPYYDFDHRGGSAVYASALDLARFGMFHLGSVRDGERVLADDTRLLMQRPATPGPTDEGYGLGWAIESDDGGYRRVSHTGGMPGVSTVLNLYPEADVAVVVLSNRSNGVVGRIAQDLAGAVLPGYADSVRAQRAALARQGGSGSNGAAHGMPAALVGRWTGSIVTPDDSVPIELVVEADGTVSATLRGAPAASLTDVSTPDGNRLVGRLQATLPDEHARRHAHTVLLDLRLRGTTLSGQASAQTTGWPYFFALTSWVEMKKS